MNRIFKELFKLPISGTLGKVFNNLNFDGFMKYQIWYYKKLGVHIDDKVTYICPDAYIDSSSYKDITIGKNVVISKQVMLLVHDYSIHNQLVNLGIKFNKGETAHYIKPIFIGDNSFIGARAFILPGTHIGRNCIIGGGSVIKGNVPDYSVVIGNPARIVGDTREWAEKKYRLHDWSV